MRRSFRPVQLRITSYVSSKNTRIPLFLCPALIRDAGKRFHHSDQRKTQRASAPRCYHTAHTQSALEPAHPASSTRKTLPPSCSGCGARTQNTSPNEAGFYNLSSRRLQPFLNQESGTSSRDKEDDIFQEALKTAELQTLKSLGFENTKDLSRSKEPKEPCAPICDRCHNLRHHSIGTPISHPSLSHLHDILLSTPHKHNHVYHVIDAADFPLSLLRSLPRTLLTLPLRGQNRRAKSHHYGSAPTMSYIITRSDLLAPRKEQVDRLMPYLAEVLRERLGREGVAARLGNVTCVSAHRGWWTKGLKQSVFNKGGGNWLVGKVNVGKSNLFDAIFPKGAHEKTGFGPLRSRHQMDETLPKRSEAPVAGHAGVKTADVLDDGSALPPPQEETPYPIMPLISELPGTTASPIRIPFDSNRGELIDLPGIARGNLADFVCPEQRSSLLMKSRIKPEQHSIKPGQSILLGGAIRITPKSEDLVVLAYPFVGLHPHVTSEEKAKLIQTQQSSSSVESILMAGAGEKVASAGVFKLLWDVTKQRAGPLTRRDAVGLKTNRLPFVVLSADILIEGCGWVELVAQVRRKDEDTWCPEVEVWSPQGKGIGIRRPMGAWALGQVGRKVVKPGERQRKSMKGAKKLEKVRKRSVTS